MLSSSDAKWKCMWYLLVWSILLTLVSQFLSILDHVAFYIFAAISVLILPVLTAVYSNTSGQHGAGLLRFGLVFCDPVLACLTVTPVLLLNKMSKVIDEYKCFQCNTPWNITYYCVVNKTESPHIQQYQNREPNSSEKEQLLNENKTEFLIIQMSIVIPIILVFLMGRRSRKMNFTTYLLGFGYWFIAALESADLLEIILIRNQYEHTIFTTEAITCIAMIVTNSYAIVTLCSFINPMGLVDNKHSKNKFDFLYRIFLAVSGILFAEIPVLVARCQILAADVQKVLPGTFYIWLMKDILWLVIIAILVYVQRFGQKYLRIPCKPRFSNKLLSFEPEKRDAYINKFKYNTYQLPTTEVIKCGEPKDLQITKCSSEPNIHTFNKDEVVQLYSNSSRSTNDLESVGKEQEQEKIEQNDKCSPKSLQAFKTKFHLNKNKTSGTRSKKNAKKQVTFKLDLGMGKFLQMKPRSDSPPVFRVENDEISSSSMRH